MLWLLIFISMWAYIKIVYIWQQNVILNDAERIDEVQNRNKNKKTILMAWIDVNIKYVEGRQLIYGENLYLVDKKE